MWQKPSWEWYERNIDLEEIMHLIQLQQFFAMGGYAQYVWSAYGLTFLVLLINILHAHVWQRQLLRQLAPKRRSTHNDLTSHTAIRNSTYTTHAQHKLSHHLRTE